jgi:thiamine kinase-like enzyme
MKTASYFEALTAFTNEYDQYDVISINSGLINHSFKATNTANHQSILLQQINQQIFTKPEQVQDNYIKIWEHITFTSHPFLIPVPLCFKNAETLYKHSNGSYWRAFEYIDDTYTPVITETAVQASQTAAVFASLTLILKDFDSSLLKTVLPGFHNLSFRFTQFEESLITDQFERLIKAKTLIKDLKERERYKHFYEVIAGSEEFPLRVMHHDAKIANVLFNKYTQQVICPVDFDTIMPGLFFSDLGDMIRTMTVSADEKSTDFTTLAIKEDFYKAITESYTEIMKDVLTASEKKYIHFAGLAMLYMQSLRFLTDYLNGDAYYKTAYTEQNFDRAMNQFILLEKLEEFLRKEYRFAI